MIKIRMKDGRVIYRANIVVIDMMNIDGYGETPVGVISVDSGRYLKVYLYNHEWNEHPDWRYYNSLKDARKFDHSKQYAKAVEFYGRVTTFIKNKEENKEV